MQVISSISALRQALAPIRNAGRAIGLVPTMGYLHHGHMTLVAQAQAENAVVVVSIFVNPLQFSANEDLSRYPRDLGRDKAMLEAQNVDFLFAPGVEDMYPQPMDAVVDVPRMGRMLEGEVRPGHFAGVATVVSKLFNIVQPDRAYFGEKDYQQLKVIERMVDDLNQPVDVIGVPTVREADGLACSSRNVYLSAAQRQAAVIVPQALDEAQRLLDAGERDPARIEAALGTFFAREPLAHPEVIALRHPETLEALTKINDEPALLLLFVRFGTTRLLDNRVLTARRG